MMSDEEKDKTVEETSTFKLEESEPLLEESSVEPPSKKVKEKKPYVKTDKRKASLEKANLARKLNQEKKQKLVKMYDDAVAELRGICQSKIKDIEVYEANRAGTPPPLEISPPPPKKSSKKSSKKVEVQIEEESEEESQSEGSESEEESESESEEEVEPPRKKKRIKHRTNNPQPPRPTPVSYRPRCVFI
jgi:hypothetical protein